VAKKREKLSDEVRRAIVESGQSRYAICKAVGLAQATMSRFMGGQGGLSMETLDALADLLDLHVTQGGANKRKKGSRRGEH
jgi:hypothetical protein